MDSKIKSFEKKPLILGKPSKFKQETNIIQDEKGVYKDPEDKKRISWEWKREIMISPIDIKRRDLNKAWANKWKKDNEIKPREKDKEIKPKWLKVDNAINFLRSNSTREFNPA